MKYAHGFSSKTMMSIAYYDGIPRDHVTAWHRKEDSPCILDAATFGVHINEGITDR
jgi:hypothetical protein